MKSPPSRLPLENDLTICAKKQTQMAIPVHALIILYHALYADTLRYDPSLKKKVQLLIIMP